MPVALFLQAVSSNSPYWLLHVCFILVLRISVLVQKANTLADYILCNNVFIKKLKRRSLVKNF